MLKRSILAASAALAAICAAPANAATIVNGSFEVGTAPGSYTTVFGGDASAITGWLVGGASVDYIGSYWAAQDGSRSIDLAGGGIGSISQAFATVAGALYNLEFWVGRNPDGGLDPRTGFVSVGGELIPLVYTALGSSRSNMLWEKKNLTFTATGPTTTLSFAADPATSNTFYGMALDNVSVSAVPEPATWAMMIFGFAVVGFSLRRRRDKSVRVSYAL